MRGREVEVVEYTDPGCSWAWGTEPKLRLLRWRYGDRLDWRRVLGGLVGDMANYVDGEFDAERAAPNFTRYWRGVGETTGMPHPAGLEWMYRSTEPACVAVKAAEAQGEIVAQRVLRRLREATFVVGRPPDTDERIYEAVRGVPGLDLRHLERGLASDEPRDAFRRDWEETRQPNDYVRNLEEDQEGSGRAKESEGHVRYVFPTLIFCGPEGERTVPGWKPYERYEQALEQVCPGVTEGARPDPSPEQAFLEFPSMTALELETLCGHGAELPAHTVEHSWGDGVLYLAREEAQARGLA